MSKIAVSGFVVAVGLGVIGLLLIILSAKKIELI